VNYGPGGRSPGNGAAAGQGPALAAGYVATAGAAAGAASGTAVAGSNGRGAGLAVLPNGTRLANRAHTSAGSPAAPVAPGSAPPAAASAGNSGASPVTAWSLLVIAVVAVGVAFSIVAPIIGTAIALIVLLALRAASTTGRQVGRRRSADGPRPSDPAVAVALYPVALIRSLLGLLLLAPIAILGFCIAVAVTIIVVPVHPLPEGVALGAGALVALVGLGPGSSGSRMALAGVFSAVSRTTAQRAVAYVGVLALVAWAGLTAWSRSTPAYWPIASLHSQLVHLPTIRTMVTDARQSLLGIVHHLGL
jgi:serine/threonine kinase PknH